MSILILNGSPRINGNTHILLNKVLEGIRSVGGDAELIHLAELQLAPCIGCGVCEQKGECAIDDDMTGLYHKIPKAQHLIIGSPIYFYNVTAQTKAFIDRCQVFWSRKYLLGRTREEEPLHYGYLVSVAATGGGKCFDCARLSLRYAFDAMDITFNGEVVVQGVDERGAVAQKEDTLQAAYELGQKIGSAA
ncbi:MAG: flavodoxin family protein [Desulfobulbaceae bacterium]|nr:flavodoxin family protein [Desulfobulbaceae bacterium]